MPLQTLFLDAGGVLMHPNWGRVADALAHHGVVGAQERDAAAERLFDSEARARHALDAPERIRTTDDVSRGRMLFDLTLAGAGLAGGADAIERAFAEVAAYQREHNLWELVPDEVRPALVRFRACGLTLAVVSNANGTLRAHMARLGMDGLVDHILDSHVEGFEKPDPRLFRIALERSGSRAETTLHVGDLYHVDVVGARAAGVRAALLDPAGLYASADCPRFASLTALAEAIEAGGP